MTRLVCVAFLAVVAYHLTGCDAESAEVTAQIVKETDEKQAIRPEAIFSHPIQYDARVSMRGAGEAWTHRFYVRGEK
jgi:hypothetical protein